MLSQLCHWHNSINAEWIEYSVWKLVHLERFDTFLLNSLITSLSLCALSMRCRQQRSRCLPQIYNINLGRSLCNSPVPAFTYYLRIHDPTPGVSCTKEVHVIRCVSGSM